MSRKTKIDCDICWGTGKINGQYPWSGFRKCTQCNNGKIKVLINSGLIIKLTI